MEKREKVDATMIAFYTVACTLLFILGTRIA
jgi:hypothetical protein